MVNSISGIGGRQPVNKPQQAVSQKQTPQEAAITRHKEDKISISKQGKDASLKTAKAEAAGK